MGLQRLEFGVRIRKFMMISVKLCYKSIWKHPFLVGLICFLILLYRSFPLLFSVFVTASPVLVCTAVLLGTLLSFGSPNMPEIDEKEEEEEEEEEEKVSYEVSQLKTGATEDHTVVERDVDDVDFFVKRHVGNRWDIVENADGKVNLFNNEVTVLEEDDGSVCYNPLVDDGLGSRDIHCQNGVIDVVDDSLVEKKREIRQEMLGSAGMLSVGEAVGNQHLLVDEIRDRNLGVEDGKLKEDLCDLPRGDELNSSLVSSWKHAAEDEDDGQLDSSLVSSWKHAANDEDGGDGFDDDDESLDSGSDGAESSSPDASITDIIPMLDELHPFLGSEVLEPAQVSDDGSNAASERSRGSNNDESVELDEPQNPAEEDNDDEGEGGAKREKEDESKSAIRWTEDDQKNLMDLGTSELERNQRLNSLIARRRARKNMRFMIEKNLIDSDGANISLNIAPISTIRRNPFELPYDSYDDLGLPPIPGSAPTILHPRRNPFDLPYDSSEEKPDLKGDSFHEEFLGINQREAVSQREATLRRHESFNVGPSSLGVPRQGHKWKPYFVPEQLVSDEASPSSFQRQSSEVSESKLSSVPDTESVSSALDEVDNKSSEQDFSQETELIVNDDHASFREEQESLSSGDVESVDVEQAENRGIHHDVVEITLGNGQNQLEMESNLSEAGATAHLELNASEIEPTSHFGQAERGDFHHVVVGITSGDGESQVEMESNLSEARATTHTELNSSEIRSRSEPVGEDFSSRSSVSSVSEIDEKIPDARGEGSAGFEPRGQETKESGISTQASFEESKFCFTSSVVDDNQHREPVHDSSPPSVVEVPPFSSVSSETQAEISEMGSPSMLVESTEKEPEGHGETAEQGTSSFQKMHAASSDLHENEPRARDLPEISEHDVTYAGSSGVSSTFADHNVSMVTESAVVDVSTDGGSSSSDEELDEHVPNKGESFTKNQVDLLSLGAEVTLAVDHGMGEMLDSSPEEHQNPMNPSESSEAEPGDRHAVEKKTQLEQDEIHLSRTSEHNLLGGSVISKEELNHTECDRTHSLNFDASLDVDSHHDKGEELRSTALAYQHMPSDDVSSSTAGESYHIVVAEVSQVDHSEANLREVHEKESEMDHVQSPCSDSKIDTFLDRDMNLEGIPSNSSYQAMPSRENSSPELEKQLYGSDKSTDEPPIDEHDKLEEPSIIATESRGEADIGMNDVNLHKVHDSEEKLSTNFSSMISESTSSPGESPEHTLPTDQEDLKNKIVNELESIGSPKEVSEPCSYGAEVYATYVDEEYISEEDNEIKQIDEGILSELDTIGDFNVKEIDLVEGSHIAYTESALLSDDSKTETNVELPVLEARSVEDIDLAFKQLHEGVDVEEVTLTSMIENQQDRADTNSILPFVEARSLEDIRNAFQQGPESNPAKLPHSSDLQNGSSEVERHNADSTKEIEVSNVDSGTRENSENAASEPKNEHEEASEKSSLSLKSKKAKSHDSNSSPSSSSSDSE